MPTIKTPVLIVGSGPAGLVTAIEVARQGVTPLVIERHATTSIFPRATGISTRSMEILRSYGLEGAVRQRGGRVIAKQATVRSLTDREPIEGPVGFPDDEASWAVSPATVAVCPQDHLEPLLVAHLRALGGEVRFGTELVSIRQEDAVLATVCDRRSGDVLSVRANYLVGADGHASAVRRSLGIPMEGPDDLGRHLSILFRANLGSVLGERRYGLYVVEGPIPDRPPTVIIPTGADDRFVLGVLLPPGLDESAVAVAFPPERCVDLVRQAAGVTDLEVELLATGSFAFGAQVAARWRAGRAFLVGDAAHRMTPRGGRGMNTAIADGHNLGWKLGAVARGHAGTGLLDTYETERGPIGRRNVALSMMQGGGTDDGLREDLGPLEGLPGQRMLHAWLDADQSRSTLDVIGPGLTLFAAADSDPWSATRALVALAAAPAVHVAAPDAIAGTGRMATGGAVLVRPDGIIAARWDRPPRDPVTELVAAIDATLYPPRASATTPRPRTAPLSMEPAGAHSTVTLPGSKISAG